MIFNEPIIIIEDDSDDIDIIVDCLQEMGVKNKVEIFRNADTAYTFLCRKEINPFIILSDINLPGINGFQLRDKIHEDEELRRKCIPYIFITTTGDSKYIFEAYSKNAQGFFIKPNNHLAWKKLLSITFDYWDGSQKPRPRVSDSTKIAFG